MTSKSEDIIYTYKVDFVECGESMGEFIDPSALNTSSSGLETYLKFKILNLHTETLRKIFMNYVFTGTNLFASTPVEEAVTLEGKPFHGRNFNIYVEKVAQFSLGMLGTMKMEDHPVALSFINIVIK